MNTDTPVVLVVEDDPPVRELLSDVLQEEAYQVVTVHDGVMALTVLESLKVDLIMLDLDLPGLNGSDFLNILRQRRVSVPPVIVITSYVPVKRSLQKMIQEVIAKPFDVDDLIGAALRLLPSRRAATPAGDVPSTIAETMKRKNS